MRVTTTYLRWLLCGLLLCLGVAACKPSQSDAKDEQPLSPAAEAAQRAASPASIGVSLRGYNFTYEGVQSFWVDGSYGANLPPYGGGGGQTCCVRLPFAWHEGQTMTVKWTIGHYTLPWEQRKHMSIDEEHRCCWSERTLEKTVPVQRYDEPSVVQVFFLPNDELEIWVSDYDLGHPDHPSGRRYPVDPRPKPAE